MKWLRALVLGATVSCQGHFQPDPTLPVQRYDHYLLVVDQELPMGAIAEGAKQWTTASGGKLVFSYESVTHTEALWLRDVGRHDTLVLVNAPGTCPEHALACYQWPGTIYFLTAKIDEYDGWSVVPAHELGHAMGLEHIDLDGNIMNPYVEFQGPVTYEDWLRLAGP